MKGIASSQSHFRFAEAAMGIAKDNGNCDFWGDDSCESHRLTEEEPLRPGLCRAMLS